MGTKNNVLLFGLPYVEIGFLFLLSIVSGSYASEQISIERYQQVRDQAAIQKILNDHYHELTLESEGYPEGTTQKNIEHRLFFTDVLRINGTTVGFVNYLFYIDVGSWKTFFFKRCGVINILGWGD